MVLEFGRIHLHVQIGTGHQPARVDRVERGIGAVGAARKVGQFPRQVGIGELRPLVELLVELAPLVPRLPEASTEGGVFAEARIGEWIEVEAVAHPHHRLAPVGDAFELRDDVARRRERHVRPVEHFGRALRSVLALNDVFGFQAVAGDLLDRLVQNLAVVGEIDRQRRRAGGDDAEHVAFVHERARDALEQIADAAGVAEIQVQVVDDDQEDAAGRVVPGPRGGQDDAFLRGWRGRRLQVEHAPAVHQGHRRHGLLDAVFVDLEVVLREIGDEDVLGVAHDYVGRDEINRNPEVGIGLALRGRGGTRGRGGGRLPRFGC